MPFFLIRVALFQRTVFEQCDDSPRRPAALSQLLAMVNGAVQVEWGVPFTLREAEEIMRRWLEDETCPFAYDKDSKMYRFLQ
jgi:hypothetical protein